MDFNDELKRQAEMLAQQKAQQPNELGLDPAATASFGQALTGNPSTAPAMMPVKQLPEQQSQDDLVTKIKALMGLGV